MGEVCKVQEAQGEGHDLITNDELISAYSELSEDQKIAVIIFIEEDLKSS